MNDKARNSSTFLASTGGQSVMFLSSCCQSVIIIGVGTGAGPVVK